MNDGTITIKDCAALLILAASLAFSTQTPAHAATVGERPGGYEATQNMTSGALPHVYQTDAAGQSLENAGAAGQTAAAAGQAAGAAGQTAADGTALGETAADGETLPVPDPVPTETAYLTAAIADGNTVAVSGKVTGEYSAEDGKLYFFALQPWQDGITGEPVMSTNEAGEFSFRLPLNEGTADTRLYSGFAAAVWLNGKYQEIGNRAYITNPETIAKSRLPYQDALTKKGLLVQMDMLDDAFYLGVKHVNVNFNFAHITNGTGINYTYEGKTYQFDAAQIAEYDKTISAFSNKSMVVTAIILNGWNERMPELVYPGVKKSSSAFYYGFNTSTKEGYETTRALASFLAERYNGENPNYGRVAHWIVGNEINNNKNWNYTGPMDLTTYAKEYVRSFRVIYTAIRSASANARVFFSIDENWNDPTADNLHYSGKALMDEVNRQIREGGNIYWNMAYHPYPYPMVEPEFWDDHNTGAVTANLNTQVIDFENLNVLTDYLCTGDYLDPAGNVRRVILSEQGFTAVSASRGNVEQIQAAAYAYAYYIADSNPYIDAFILSRQVDAPSEVRTSCSFGLWSCRMDVGDQIISAGRRKIWVVFKNIDKKNETLENTEFAKAIIGISRWSDVIPNFRWKNME